MKKFVWGAMTLLCLSGALVSAFAALFMPTMFDAPGSEANRKLQAMAVCIILMPMFCLLGALLPWVLRPNKVAGWLFLLPVIDIAAIAVLNELLSP